LAAAAVAGWFAADRDDWRPRAVVHSPWAVGPLAFSRNGKALATWMPGVRGSAGLVSLRDAADGRRLADWPVSEPAMASAAFAPDGATFAFLTWKGGLEPLAVGRFEVATGRPLPAVAMEPFSARHSVLYEVSFTPDGAGLRAAIGDTQGVRELVTWDAATGRELERRTVSCPVSNGPRAFTRDGRFMAAAAYGTESATVWDLDADRAHAVLVSPTPPQPSPLGRPVSCLAFSPDGATLVVAREDSATEFWDLKSAKLIKSPRVHTPGYVATTLRFTPDGATLVSVGGFRRPVAVVDVFMTGLTDWWRRGKRRATATEGIVFDVAAGRRLARLKSVGLPLLSDDGRTLATADNGATAVRLWDVPGPPGR